MRDTPRQPAPRRPAPRRDEGERDFGPLGWFGPWAGLIALCLVLFTAGMTSLPPFDRDEARFAQASRQMVETGDWVHIRLQDEPRNKKPIGIYWAQASVASAVEKVTGQPAAIWAYRIPSVLAGIASVLLLFWGLRKETGDRPAFLAASLLGGSLLVGVEAHLAKTDAMQLACTVAAAMALLRLYRHREYPAPSWTMWLFWVALGAGILVKGPVVPMVAGLTLLALWWADRKGEGSAWMKALKPLSGLPVLILIVAPWTMAIIAGSSADAPAGSGSFFEDAIKGDLLPKLIGGQEGHGQPPGYYLALAMVLFFPGSLVLIPALVQGWKDRAEPLVRFALAWAIPTWVVFEIIPTKLPHYVLPAFPALAMLVTSLVVGEEAERALRRWWGRLGILLWALVALALAGAAVCLSIWLDKRLDPLALAPALILVGAGGWVVWAALKGEARQALMAAIATGGVAFTLIYSTVLPRLDAFWLSRGAAQTLATVAPNATALGAVGYAEPSLVFQTRTDILLGNATEGAALLKRMPGAVVLVADREQAKMDAALKAAEVETQVIGSISGFNYSKGRPVTLTLIRRKLS
ncbi:ArnT family glycosyltransferase [Lacibacterium aquatile]|uniref:ArnT family glycosyltransferase n=1 Tax=Lacibacterium aquatile TaxID=1168082 RepID=A0ABW5DUN4_9PROT